MVQRIAVALCLALAFGTTASSSEWRMRVHEGESITEFPVADIDSLSIFEYFE